MLHENDLNKKININDTDINFENIYKKEYIPQKYIEDIKNANVLIIPNEFFGDRKILSFPECTSEFYHFLKNRSEIQTEICIDDDKYEKLELHADIIYMATLIVQYAALPILVNLISSFLYDKVKSMNKEVNKTNMNIHIVVEEKGKTKKISYEGSIEYFEKSMRSVENDLFK